MKSNSKSLTLDSKKLENLSWLNSKEAANYLRISVGTLRNMTSNGEIPYYKLGRRNRYLLQDLCELLLNEMRGRSL